MVQSVVFISRECCLGLPQFLSLNICCLLNDKLIVSSSKGRTVYDSGMADQFPGVVVSEDTLFNKIRLVQGFSNPTNKYSSCFAQSHSFRETRVADLQLASASLNA